MCFDNKERVGEQRESGPRNRLAPDDYYYTQVERARGERVLYSVLYPFFQTRHKNPPKLIHKEILGTFASVTAGGISPNKI